MINLEKVAQQLGFELQEVQMLLEMFQETATQSMQTLESAIEAKDFEIIKQEAHSIKGSAANLMLDDIFNISKELEDSAKDRLDINYKRIYSMLETHLESLREEELLL